MTDSDTEFRLARHRDRMAEALSAAAALIWIAQAAVLAQALGALLAGRAAAPVLAALLFAGLGLARIVLAERAEARAQAQAERALTEVRRQIVAVEARRASDGSFGGAGAVAALAGDMLAMTEPYLTRYALARARVMIVPPVILVLAVWQSWAAGLVLLLAGPLIPVFMALVGLAAKEESRRQMTEIGGLNDLLVERLGAVLDIRVLGARPRVLDDFAAQADRLRARTMAVLRVAFLSSTVLELFAAIGVAMIAVFVGFSLLGAITFGTWGGPLTPEAGLFLLLLAPEFFQPLRDLAAAWHDKAAAEAAEDALRHWQADPGEVMPGTGRPVAPLAGPALIRLPAGPALPDGVEIPQGTRLAITGPSGAGKTTLLRRIAGLVETPGLEVCGVPLDGTTADAWRARIGWMPQAPRFPNETLRQVILAGRGGDPGAAVRAAALEPVIARLPRGLSTRLGETGGGLSGGEARRVLLARALQGAPDVILADEPTADLDPETAALVTEGLLAAAGQGATLIVATHDLALAARMDRQLDLGGQACARC